MADDRAPAFDFARDGWAASQWFNSEAPPTLAGLKGKVVVLHTFQMLCPGCVAHGLPQAQKVHRLFPRAHVEVIDVLIRKALEKTNLKIADLDGIAAAGGPGLIGGVIVGVMTAKAIAAVRGSGRTCNTATWASKSRPSASAADSAPPPPARKAAGCSAPNSCSSSAARRSFAFSKCVVDFASSAALGGRVSAVQ